jgi:hypothetical protein
MYFPQSVNAHPVFDQMPEQNYPAPLPKWRVRRIQDQLDKVAGKAPNGKSNVRLIWAADPEFAMDLVRMPDGTTEKKARYRLWTDEYECVSKSAEGLDVVTFVDVDIVIPRYVVEEYHLPQEESFGSYREGLQGQGFYTHLFSVAHHDEHCCNGTEGRKGHVCMGLYRDPGDADVRELQRRVRLRDEHLARQLGTQASYEELLQDARDLRTRIDNDKQNRRRIYREVAMNAVMPMHKRLFTADPSVHASGGYHWTTGSRPSGLTAAQLKDKK